MNNTLSNPLKYQKLNYNPTLKLQQKEQHAIVKYLHKDNHINDFEKRNLTLNPLVAICYNEITPTRKIISYHNFKY